MPLDIRAFRVSLHAPTPASKDDDIYREKYSTVYFQDIRKISEPTKLVLAIDICSLILPILTSTTIAVGSIRITSSPNATITITDTTNPLDHPLPLYSVPIFLCQSLPSSCKIQSLTGNGGISSQPAEVADSSICHWLCMGDVCGSFLSR